MAIQKREELGFQKSVERAEGRAEYDDDGRREERENKGERVGEKTRLLRDPSPRMGRRHPVGEWQESNGQFLARSVRAGKDAMEMEGNQVMKGKEVADFACSAKQGMLTALGYLVEQ